MNSPYINRFLQPDSIIPDLSNPQSWNRYSYVTNRPVNFNDPTGHVQACEFGDEGDCGRGANTEEIVKYFSLNGNWGGLWAEYYGALHEVSLSTEEYRVNPNQVTLNIMSADVNTARSYKLNAFQHTPQISITTGMQKYPDILGDGYVEGAMGLGSDEGAGPGGIDTGGPGLFPEFQTLTPTPTRMPSPTPTRTPTSTPTPRRPNGPTPIPRRISGELIDL